MFTNYLKHITCISINVALTRFHNCFPFYISGKQKTGKAKWEQGKVACDIYYRVPLPVNFPVFFVLPFLVNLGFLIDIIRRTCRSSTTRHRHGWHLGITRVNYQLTNLLFIYLFLFVLKEGVFYLACYYMSIQFWKSY